MTQPTPTPSDPSAASAATDRAAVTVAHVTYRQIGGINLPLHLFRPDASSSPCPVVVCIHGGGWIQGRPDQFFRQAHRLAEQGFAACAIGYRLAHQARFSAAIEDCRAAVDWLRRHARPWALDPDRIGLWGSSAGGHLAACLATWDDNAAGIRCMVDVHGVHDLRSLADLPVAEKCEALLGVGCDKAPDLWRHASPLQHVMTRTAPALLLHDPDDPLVPLTQSLVYHEALHLASLDGRAPTVRR